MITLVIPETLGIVTKGDARKFTREHVVMSKRDIKRIAALAKKHGLYKDLKALGVTMYELSPREGEGSW